MRRLGPRQRLLLLLGVGTIGAHLVTAAWLTELLPIWAVVPLLGALLALAMWPVATVLTDHPRPAWVRWCRLVATAHFAGMVFALPPQLLLLIVGLACGGFAEGPAAASAIQLAATLVAWWGVFGARRFVATPLVEVRIQGLPQSFAGYRIVQLSDLHVGSVDGLSAAQRWVDIANKLDGDLTVVTGDLVTSGTHFYGRAAEALGGLRAPDGVWVILGNHDQWDAPAFTRTIEDAGPRVLANSWVAIERDGAQLILAGLDDPYSGRADLAATLRGRPAGARTVLLSHYPSWFRKAAALGVELTLSGHTHGGQVALPGLSRYVNAAMNEGGAVRGLHRRGNSQLYVNTGLGTTGPPLRLGVRPEVAVLVLQPAELSDD